MNTLIAFMFLATSILGAASPPDPTPQSDSSAVGCQPHFIDGYEMPGWVTNETWYREMPQYTTGRAVWYAPNLMRTTAEFRGMSLDGFLGGIATSSAGMMGKVAWLKRPGYSWEGPYLIVDVSQRNHAYYHAVHVGTIVEVDFETAARWGIVTKTGSGKGYRVNMWSVNGVEMWIGLEPPNIAGGVIIGEPVNYKEWYLEHASFCDGEENRRWKLEDWMIKNYQDYEALLISEGGEVSLQQMGKELNEEEIAKAVAIKNYLASLTPEEVAGFMPEPVPVMAKEVVIETEEESDGILAIHRLKKDETWTHLALQYYGHMSEPYWRLIYEANIDLVGEDYHCIWGGMELVVPILPPGFSP